MKSIKELVSHIASLEGKKHQASVGDIKEIVGIISDMVHCDATGPEYQSNVIDILEANGRRRLKSKIKKEMNEATKKKK